MNSLVLLTAEKECCSPVEHHPIYHPVSQESWTANTIMGDEIGALKQTVLTEVVPTQLSGLAVIQAHDSDIWCHMGWSVLLHYPTSSLGLYTSSRGFILSSILGS